MTKEELIKQRDELAIKYGVHIVDNFHSLGTYKQADFKAGFDAACEVKDKELTKMALHTFDQGKEIIKLKEKIEQLEEREKFLVERLDIAIETLKDYVSHDDYYARPDEAIEALKKIRGEK